MKDTEPIYITGHQHPDTDSVASAIAYAFFKRAKGIKAIPCRLGPLNNETNYLLKRFGFEAPMLLDDARKQIREIEIDPPDFITPETTVFETLQLMNSLDRQSFAVLDDNYHIVGFVSTSDLAKIGLGDTAAEIELLKNTSVDHIAEAINGTILYDDVQSHINGKVSIISLSKNRTSNYDVKDRIVIIGDDPDSQLDLIANKGAGLLIVVWCDNLREDVMEAAKKYHCPIIKSGHGSMNTSRFLYLAPPVKLIMKMPHVFKDTELVEDAAEMMMKTRYRNYPVVENGRLVGIVSRDNLTMPERDRVILVDHNERGQAVEGIEAAKIVEIIDHHRLGGIQTSEPIYTHAEPVGCTATIVANMHWHRDIDIPQSIAGLLLSAILSDTVLFKSPTCTPYDKKTAERLAEIAGVDIQEYGMAMLKAGSGIGDMTPMEIAKNDLKEFTIGDYRIIVSQISVMDTKEVMDLEPQLIEAMSTICEKEGFDMSLVMVTDILEEATYLLYAGSPKTLIGEAFKKDASGTHVYLPGVMSRKKQIIPPLSEAVKRIEKK